MSDVMTEEFGRAYRRGWNNCVELMESGRTPSKTEDYEPPHDGFIVVEFNQVRSDGSAVHKPVYLRSAYIPPDGAVVCVGKVQGVVQSQRWAIDKGESKKAGHPVLYVSLLVVDPNAVEIAQ